MTMKISSELLRLLNQNNSFLIAGHISPEGDSIGSTLALALGLRKLGKKDVCVLSRDPVPANLKFLPSSGTIRKKPPRKKYDVLVLVDCNEVSRTGFDALNADRTIVIDHHVVTTGSEFFRSVSASLIDPDAAAAGVLVYSVLNALNISVDRKIASNLYAALLVDTGGFRYSNVSAECLKIASELIGCGAKPWDISREIYENVPYRAMKLLGLSLSTLETVDGIAWITTTRSMFKKTGTTAEDSEEFVEFPRKVKDIKVAIFFRQNGNRSYKLSLRSKGKVNVQKIARSFGGGGHAAAAGCTVKGTLKEVQEKVFKAVRKAIQEI